MKTQKMLVLAAAAIALSLLAAPGTARADGDTLDRRVDVALADADPHEAFESLAKMVNLDSAIEPGLDGKVTVRLKNVRMRTVLDAVCESIGCRWDVAGSPAKLHILPLPESSARKATLLDEPIDLKVTNADLRQVLQTFGQIMSVDVDLDPRVTGKVSFELDNVPVRNALDHVCAAGGCTWKLEEGKSPILRITAKR
jgi:type II secretory pathway component GspD/PulD (secretin)